MRPNVFDVDLIDVDDNGIAENQTTAGADDLILNGALADLGTALEFEVVTAGYSAGTGGVQIAIDSAGDVSAVNFTVTGLDENGKSQTETITGVTTTAVESTKYWSKITSIAADAAVASNVFVGPVDESATKMYPIDWRSTEACNIHVDVTGTIDFTVQQTFANVLAGETPVWTDITALAAKTADTTSTAAIGATAIRLKVNSYSSGAELQMYTSQVSSC
jgi:hypothetical protein